MSQKKLFRDMSALLQQEPGAAPGWEQRSRGGKTYWIRRERFDPEGFFVAGVPYAEAKKFVKTQHYSRAWALSVVNIGLYKDRPGRKPKLCGVAVFGMGPGATTLNKYFYDLRALELVRFVLVPEVKYYGETWFLRRAFAMLKQASWRGEGIEHYGGAYLGDRPLEGILAFSDPVPRTKLSGEEVMPGHVGHIYQAYGGLYSGRAGAHKDNILLPDGTVIDKRSQGKVSRQEQGAEGVYERLVAGGSSAQAEVGDLASVDGCGEVREALPPADSPRHPRLRLEARQAGVPPGLLLPELSSSRHGGGAPPPGWSHSPASRDGAHRAARRPATGYSKR